MPGQIPNLTFASMKSPKSTLINSASGTEAKESGTATARADVMRLTAHVDELTQRLKKAQSKLEATEAHLTRTSQVLCHERQANSQTLLAYKKDLARSHQTENALQAEIASNKKKDTVFMDSVTSALASDEHIRVQQRNLSELETKVSAMGEFKVKLEKEIATLEGLTKKAEKDLDELHAAQGETAEKTRLVAFELDAVQANIAVAKDDHNTLLNRITDAKVEEAAISERVSALHTTYDVMEKEVANSTNASKDALLRHGDTCKKLAEVQARLDDLTAQESALVAKLATADADSALKVAESVDNAVAEDDDLLVAVQPPTPLSTIGMDLPGPLVRRRATISGAFAPNNELCTGPSHRLTEPATAPTAVAAIHDIDSPVGLTLTKIGFVGAKHVILASSSVGGAGPKTADGKYNETAMITAVVNDLKMKLGEISQEAPVWRQVAPLA